MLSSTSILSLARVDTITTSVCTVGIRSGRVMVDLTLCGDIDIYVLMLYICWKVDRETVFVGEKPDGNVCFKMLQYSQYQCEIFNSRHIRIVSPCIYDVYLYIYCHIAQHKTRFSPQMMCF